MKLHKKYHLPILFIFMIIAIILVTGLWDMPLQLCLTLALTALLKHTLVPIHQEFATFLLLGILGTSAESLMMLAGSWQYTTPHLLNFPLWLPLLWGLAGTIGISLYQTLFATIK